MKHTWWMLIGMSCGCAAPGATIGFYIVPGYNGLGNVNHVDWVHLSSSGRQVTGCHGPSGPADIYHNFVYDVGGAYHSVPHIIGNLAFTARNTNADGEVFVGTAGRDASGGVVISKYSTVTDELVPLGSMPQYEDGWPRAVSDDGGTTVGGYETTTNTFVGVAFKHTDAAGLVGLGYAMPFHYYSFASDVSGDGSVIVGYSFGGSSSIAFRWTTQTGMQPLPYFDVSQGRSSVAMAVSRNGQYIVGASDRAGPTLIENAVLWRGNGVIGLGTLPGHSNGSNAFGVSDGGIVVGVGSNDITTSPFYWSQASGMVHLATYLASVGVQPPAGTTLLKALDISADGSAILGWANSPTLGNFAFVAVVSGCPGCAADYNGDGGIDGSDVASFFTDWEDAIGCCDVNQDGGVDGADVEEFFGRWEAGGCS